MTLLSKTAYKTLYSNSSGTFADNTTRDISEADLRQFAEDTADSFQSEASVIGDLTFIEIPLGDWDMDATDNISIGSATLASYGISDFKTIRSVTCIIRNDADSAYSNLTDLDASFAVKGRVTGWTSLGVSFFRVAAGFYDSTDYNATSYNRGFAVIGYEGS